MTQETRCNDILGVVNNLVEVVQQQTVAIQQLDANLQLVTHDRQNNSAETYKLSIDLNLPAFEDEIDPEIVGSLICERE